MFWRPVGAKGSNKSDNVENKIIPLDLESDVSYEVVGKADNGNDTSRLTKPVLFEISNTLKCRTGSTSVFLFLDIVNESEMPSITLTSKARRPKNSWHMMTSKVMGVYQVNLIYRSGRGECGPFSSSPQCVTAKVPWGPPVSCEYRLRKDSQTGEIEKEFRFINKRRETANFSAKLLNNIKTETDVTAFGQRVTSLVIAEKKHLLANYLTLLQHAKDFIHHSSGHDEDGFSLDGQGVTLKNLEENGGSLTELRSFVEVAKSGVHVNVNIEKLIQVKAKGKRTAGGNEEGAKPAKMSNAATINYNEKKELEDPNGLEKQLQDAYIGVAWIPLDSISVSKDLVKVNIFRVYSIADNIRKKYDPSLATAVICPVDDSEEIDLDNCDDRKYFVVQKVHLISAYKEMDKLGEFEKLFGHHHRKVLAYIINTNSPALVHFSNMRSNEILSQYASKMCPQNLLHVFASLEKKMDKDIGNKKVVERMAKHSRTGPAEITSVMKLCSWSTEGFRSLISVIEVYEVFETRDVTKKGRYGALLANGEKLRMSNSLFNSLAKCDEKFFQENAHQVISGDISLQSLIEENLLRNEIKKISGILSQISGYQSTEKLARKYPNKFEPKVLKAYIGAEIKDGKFNQKALELLHYYEKVLKYPSKEITSPVQFREFGTMDELISPSIAENFDTILLQMNEPSQDLCMSIIKTVLSSDEEYHTALMIFSSEDLQYEALQFLRSQQISLIRNLRIVPVLFQKEKPSVDQDLLFNISFGILFGKMKPMSPPLKILQSNIKNLMDIVLDVVPPGSKIAALTAPGLPMVQIHSEKLLHEVTYFGSKKDLSQFQTGLSKDRHFFDRPHKENQIEDMEAQGSVDDDDGESSFSISDDESSLSISKTVAEAVCGKVDDGKLACGPGGQHRPNSSQSNSLASTVEGEAKTVPISEGSSTSPVKSDQCTSSSSLDDSGLGFETESQAKTSLSKKFGEAVLEKYEFNKEKEDVESGV